jgi:hypothetical protein
LPYILCGVVNFWRALSLKASLNSCGRRSSNGTRGVCSSVFRALSLRCYQQRHSLRISVNSDCWFAPSLGSIVEGVGLVTSLPNCFALDALDARAASNCLPLNILWRGMPLSLDARHTLPPRLSQGRCHPAKMLGTHISSDTHRVHTHTQIFYTSTHSQTHISLRGSSPQQNCRNASTHTHTLLPLSLSDTHTWSAD